MKKILMFFMALWLLTVSAFCAEAETVSITNAMLDKATTVEAGDAELVSLGTVGKNDVISFDMEIDFTGKDGNTASFDGFQLRAKDSDKVCWATDCYVIIIRENTVEIQSFYQGENVFYLNRTCEIPKNKKVNVTLGAVDTEEKGTFIFIKIDDKLYGAYDPKSRLKEDGHFNFEWRSTAKITEAKEADATVFAPTLLYDSKENKVLMDKTFILGQTDDIAYKWYMSNEGYVNKERDLTSLEENFTLVDGEESDSFLVMDSDIGKCVYCEVTAGGVTYNTKVLYISPVSYVMNNGFVACVGYSGAIAEGEKFVFDRDNANVYADSKGEFAYLPVRSIAEAYGMPVKWEAEESIVSISATADDDTRFKIGEQGFIRLRNLMGSSMPGVPYINENRTFVDASAMLQILDYKSLFYDESTGLVTFTKSAVKLSESEISDLIYEIEEIK